MSRYDSLAFPISPLDFLFSFSFEFDDNFRFLIAYTRYQLLDNLKDLLRFLRRDDPQTRDVFKQVCKWNMRGNRWKGKPDRERDLITLPDKGNAVINAAESGSPFPLKRRDRLLDYSLALMGRDDEDGFAD
ncbi:hypothetical protein ACSQ67_017944 [Phaseolus vulgaris]